MKIVICGGHLTPALALIEQIVNRPDYKIYFFGRKHSTEGAKNLSAEYQVISKKNIKFIAITAGRLQRKFTRYTILSLLKIPVGFLQSFYYLFKIRPSLIVSFGSYVSTPIVFSGWLLGIDSITHDPAPTPGLATKINSLFVKKIFLAWPQSQKYFDSDKSQVIGNLIRRAVFSKIAKSPEIKKFLGRAKNLIYVTGGNQGSHFINQLVFDSQKKLNNFSILHQLGTVNFEKDYEKSKNIKSSNYKAVSYIDSEDVGAVFNKANIIISRSGANIASELVLLARPAILIPLTVSSGNEQMENAKILEKAGCAIVLKQESLTVEIFIKSIQKVFENLPKYQKSAQSFKKSLPENAVKRMEKYILSLLNSHNL